MTATIAPGRLTPRTPSLPLLVLLTDLCVRTSRIGARVRIALDRGRAGDSGGAVVVDQSGAPPLLRGGGIAVGAVGALGEWAVAPAAHDLDADVTGREAGDRAGTDDDIGFGGLGGVFA